MTGVIRSGGFFLCAVADLHGIVTILGFFKDSRYGYRTS